MAHLSINLLGTFRVALDGASVTTIESDRGRALLAYLLLEMGQPHRREVLTALFWPDATGQRARQNLRRSLYNLRQVLEGNGPEAPYIQASRQTIEFNPASDYWLDVKAFTTRLDACQAHPHRRLNACPDCIGRLAEAVELYHGDFLAGLSLSGSDPFEGWRLFRQEELHSRALEALTALAIYHERRRDYGTAAGYLRRQIELEPWREEAHRQLMKVLALKGERSAALQQYEACRRILVVELSTEPEPETAALYERIETGDLRVELIDVQNPYKGLQAFTEADAADFFGREAFVERLLEALDSQRVVVVLGPSGSGKSSVVQAGLLPRLHRMPNRDVPGPELSRHTGSTGSSADSDRGPAPGRGSGEGWLILGFRPGDRPLHRLAEVLIPLAEPHLDADQRALEVRANTVAQQLYDGELGLADVVERALREARQHNRAACRLLLVVDQLEEVYTLCRDSSARRAFLDVLLQPGALDPKPESPPLTLLLPLRADFTAQALSHGLLSDAMQDGGLVLGPMTRDQLRRAVEEPARSRGVIFEPGLLERLLHDAGNELGNLPLLQFTLTLLWEQQTNGQLSHAAYGTLGGLEGALTCYADSVYEGFDPEEREGARRVFTQLVRLGAGTQDTSRQATRAELGDDWGLVRRLADARLVVTGREQADLETAELVHEALIQNWDLLRAWIDADRSFHAWRQRLRTAIKQWAASGQDVGALLYGMPLVEAEEWALERPTELRAQEREFIDVSVARRDGQLAEAEARRQKELSRAQALAEAEHQRAEAEGKRADVEARARRRLRLLAIGYAMILAIVLGVATWAWQQQEMTQHVAAGAQSLALANNVYLAQADGNTDLALALATEAYRVAGSPPEVQRILAQAAYAPSTRRILIGHDGPVHDLAVSPDGQIAISASADGTLIVWDVATGTSLRRLTAQDDAVHAVAVDPNARTALSGTADGSLILWDLASGDLLRHFTGHQDAVLDVVISPDGKTALSGAADKTLILWDLATGQATRRLSGHAGPVLSVAISPDGATALSGSADHGIILWDLTTGLALRRMVAPDEAVAASQKDPQGQIDRAWAVAFSPDGHKAVAAAQDGNVGVWDVTTGERIANFRSPGAGLSSMAVSPDGRAALLGTVDNQVALLDLATGQSMLLLAGHKGPVSAVAFAAAGRHALSASADGTLRLWDLQSGAELRRLNDASFGTGVDVSPDGQTALTATVDGSVQVWDYESGDLVRRLHGHSEPVLAGAHFTPDGKAVVSGSGAISGVSGDNTLRLWGMTTGEELQRFEGHTGRLWDVAVSPDGQHAASGSEDGTLRLWDLGRGTGRIVQDVTPQAVRSLAFSPDGQTLLVGLARGQSSAPDYSLLLLDVDTGQEIRRFEGHEEMLTDVAFSPDGLLALSGAMDQQVILWDVATGKLARYLAGYPRSVLSVAFSPDGQLAAAGGVNGEILLWDVASGVLLRALTGHESGVLEVVFTPGGTTLLSVANDGTVREWRVDASLDVLLAWVEANRYIPQLTCEQRARYGVDPLCVPSNTPSADTR